MQIGQSDRHREMMIVCGILAEKRHLPARWRGRCEVIIVRSSCLVLGSSNM